MYAAWFDHPEAVRALLSAGALIKRRCMQFGNLDDPYM